MLMLFVYNNSSNQNNFLESQQKSVWDVKPFSSMYVSKGGRNCSFVLLYVTQNNTFSSLCIIFAFCFDFIEQ